MTQQLINTLSSTLERKYASACMHQLKVQPNTMELFQHINAILALAWPHCPFKQCTDCLEPTYITSTPATDTHRLPTTLNVNHSPPFAPSLSAHSPPSHPHCQPTHLTSGLSVLLTRTVHLFSGRSKVKLTTPLTSNRRCSATLRCACSKRTRPGLPLVMNLPCIEK